MLRCMYCHRPMNIPKRVLEELWPRIEAAGQPHVDLTCPRCGRVNKVSIETLRKRLGVPRARNQGDT